MEKEVLQKITKYVENNIGDFHKKRIEKVKSIDLIELLKAKNPYLFKAKNITSAPELVPTLLSAYMSSSEEGIFGNWLEGLAIFINGEIYGGQKSAATGIDLEFVKDSVRYIVVIKSGPMWGNSSQLEKMGNHFQEARKRLATSGHKEVTVCVNGCCYGKDATPHKFPKVGSEYYKYCGQEFWSFISGDDNLYIDIVEPLGHKALEKNTEYSIEYGAIQTKLTADFTAKYCDKSYKIKWEEIVKINSEKPAAKVKKGATKTVKKARVGKLEQINKKQAAKKNTKR
jgi:hypothetical protein